MFVLLLCEIGVTGQVEFRREEERGEALHEQTDSRDDANDYEPEDKSRDEARENREEGVSENEMHFTLLLLATLLCQGRQESTKKSAGRRSTGTHVCVLVLCLVGQRMRKYTLIFCIRRNGATVRKRKFAEKKSNYVTQKTCDVLRML